MARRAVLCILFCLASTALPAGAAVKITVNSTEPAAPIYLNDDGQVSFDFTYLCSGEALTAYIKVGGGGSPSDDGGLIASETLSGTSGSVDVTFTAAAMNRVDPTPGDGTKTIYIIVEAEEGTIDGDYDYDDDYDLFLTAADGDRELVLADSETIESAYVTLTVRLDNAPPPQVTLTDPAVTGGDGRILITWSAVDETDEPGGVTYDVAVASADDGGASFSDTATGIDDTSHSVSGLENGTAYSVTVRAVDRAGNTGAWSEAAIGSPQEVDDFWRFYKKNGGREPGGFCFVATAAFGDYNHPAVRVLRLFRDRALLSSRPGRGVVAAYWTLSPPLARAIEGRPALSAAARALLWPVTVRAWLMLHPAVLFGLLLLGLGVPTALARVRKGGVR